MNDIKKIILESLAEDMPNGDITTDNLDLDFISTGYFIAKDEMILSGIEIAKEVFLTVDENVSFIRFRKDGDKVSKKDVIAKVTGKTSSLLKAERTALNLLQRMSGIATKTSTFTEAIKKYETKILDTRKTVPGLRILDKKAVLDGGGVNHRFSLSDQVLIKDNHIKAAKSITNAVKLIKEKVSHDIKTEVEVETFEELIEALNTEVDIIMLDNMDLELMKKCVKENNKKKLLEASGNMTIDRVVDVAKIGVDFISVGELTHSVKAADISFKIE